MLWMLHQGVTKFAQQFEDPLHGGFYPKAVVIGMGRHHAISV